MKRREFLRQAGWVSLLGMSVTVIACSDDEGTPTNPGGGGSGDVTGQASGGGHTHSGVITEAQLDAGVAVSIAFSGSGHSHSLPLTESEVEMIAGGQRVEKDHDDRHLHTYVFNA